MIGANHRLARAGATIVLALAVSARSAAADPPVAGLMLGTPSTVLPPGRGSVQVGLVLPALSWGDGPPTYVELVIRYGLGANGQVGLRWSPLEPSVLGGVEAIEIDGAWRFLRRGRVDVGVTAALGAHYSDRMSGPAARVPVTIAYRAAPPVVLEAMATAQWLDMEHTVGDGASEGPFTGGHVGGGVGAAIGLRGSRVAVRLSAERLWLTGGSHSDGALGVTTVLLHWNLRTGAAGGAVAPRR